ncbi:asparagine synthase [Oleiagrimonas sp. C23AA]|uniref:asparagine synthase n=1 Tax=Oleiagrimonas sp. C23AA TaxID=2719047 RepID=UPI001F10A6D9|nr:asparagine synthase [Oleiagrimonas sp. C23AA]
MSGRLDEGALRGNFALFLSTGDHTWLLNDALGFVRIHASSDGRFFTTSWLAACAYLPTRELDPGSAVEYVLLGAVHSRHSVVRGVSLLPIGHAKDLVRRTSWQRFPDGLVPPSVNFDSLPEALRAVGEHLTTVSKEVATAFPNKINTALSGGFDSRLIVAGLLAAGIRPNLFVYGAPDFPDVAIASAVASSVGLTLETINKAEINRGLCELDIRELELSALFFDGLPSDGIDDPGADRNTRLRQTAEGNIALNGGGGEIFRNFFHLPDRPLSALDLVRTFYRGFSRRAFRDSEGMKSYEARLVSSMRAVLGVQNKFAHNGDLTRFQIELLYPLFRCHYWMSVNNSLAIRHGYYMTPLVDLKLIRLSQRLPLRWKNAGYFESQLISFLHSDIAKQPSAHGFKFSEGPGLSARLSEVATCYRPVGLRPMINATRRRLGKVRVAPTQLKRYRKLLPGEWVVDSFLDLSHLPDNVSLARALALEIVWRRIL